MDGRLARLGQPIPELARDLWMVTHDVRRQERPVRLVADRLAGILGELGPLLRGERPDAWRSPAALTDDARAP
jgi:hypothetical protein